MPAAALASVAHGDWCERQGRRRVSGTLVHALGRRVDRIGRAAENLLTRSSVKSTGAHARLGGASRGYHDGLRRVQADSAASPCTGDAGYRDPPVVSAFRRRGLPAARVQWG